MAIEPITVKRSTKQPIPFDINIEEEKRDEAGEGIGEYEIVTHTFHARAKVAGSILLDVTASATVGADYQAAAIRRFLNSVILPKERVGFWKLLDESDPPIEMDDLGKIVGSLMEEYGDRPTDTPSA